MAASREAELLRLGVPLMLAGCLLVAMGFVQPAWFAGVLISAAIGAAVVPVVYSYIVWRGEQEGRAG